MQTERKNWRVFSDNGLSGVGQGQYKRSIPSFFLFSLFADCYRYVVGLLLVEGFLFVLINTSQPVML